MKIKALLSASAAAFVMVSGAQAADAIVAAEPEPMEYVRVCDAFGTGYFYIPGTETCLKVSGYIRFQTEWSSFDRGNGADDFDWNSRTRGLISFDAKNDTELGTLASTLTLRTWAEGDYNGGSVEIDEAFMTLGGFRAGYGYNYWDNDLSGETDDIGSNRINQIGYEFTASNFKVGAFVDELTQTYSGNTALYSGNDNVGFEAQISGTLGPVSAALLGSYDVSADNGAVRLIATADVGPGTFGIAGIYSSGENAYYDLAEWTVAAEYAAKITDKLKLTPGFQYWNNIDIDSSGDFAGDRDQWRAGLTLDYAITKGLSSKVSVQYTEPDDAAETWSGFFRLQRTF